MGLVVPQTSQDADKVKENNINNQFYWMLNAKGAKVPVAHTYVKEALKRGYQHTDGKVCSEDPKENVRYGRKAKPRPQEQMAEAISKLADVVSEEKEEAPKKKVAKKKATKKEEPEEVVEEKK